MNVYDQLLMEFPGIETTLTSYSSECHATMLLPSLKQALTNYDKERALYCLGEMDNWYQKNLSKIYSNSYVFHKDEHLRVAELIHLSIQKISESEVAPKSTAIGNEDTPDSTEPIIFLSHCSSDKTYGDILEKFKFDGHITTMANKGILYIVLKEYTTDRGNLHPNEISNLEMGYIFEEIIRRFSESHNEDAGQHYTPREVIQLMVNILFYDDNDILSGNNVAKTIYDPACGTGGMLSVAEEYLHSLNASTELVSFGQEINDQTFAICKADMLIKGNNADYIKDGNTLSDDQFAGSTFDYILSNPPFGREWKNEKAKVEEEAKLGFGGRFGAGLPAASDGQMLFLMTAISKMKDIDKGGSRIAIIHNGSPLFTGDAGSGPSEIRRYILENDLLEAIIALPNDIFYNTGIATYIWVLSNKKAGTVREGKVQLINANEMFVKRRKALGNKRNDISKEDIAEITKIYGDFKESEISQIYDNEDFGYTKITVERPLRDEEGNLVLKKGKKQPDTSLRDTENVPLKEDIKEYFEREVLPFAPDAWVDEKKSKVGYEIPFTRYFYKYEAPRPSAEIMAEIMDLETELSGSLEEVFDL